eukprot:1603503-Amphidinium_carterae.2
MKCGDLHPIAAHIDRTAVLWHVLHECGVLVGLVCCGVSVDACCWSTLTGHSAELECIRARALPHILGSWPYLFACYHCKLFSIALYPCARCDFRFGLIVACFVCFAYVVAIMVKSSKRARPRARRKSSTSTSSESKTENQSGSGSYYSYSSNSSSAKEKKKKASLQVDQPLPANAAEPAAQSETGEPAEVAEPATELGSEPSPEAHNEAEAETPAAPQASASGDNTTQVHAAQAEVIPPLAEEPAGDIEGGSNIMSALLGESAIPMVESATETRIPPPPVPSPLDIGDTIDDEITNAVEASRKTTPVTSEELQRHTFLTGKLHVGMSFCDVRLISESENQLLRDAGMEVGVLRRRMQAYKSISLAALRSRGSELWAQTWLLSWGNKKFRAQDVQTLVREFESVATCSRKRLEFVIWTLLKAFLKVVQEIQQDVTSRNDTGVWKT